MNDISFSLSVLAAFCPLSCNFCYNNHGSGNGSGCQYMPCCHAVAVMLLCHRYAMLCYAVEYVLRTQTCTE